MIGSWTRYLGDVVPTFDRTHRINSPICKKPDAWTILRWIVIVIQWKKRDKNKTAHEDISIRTLRDGEIKNLYLRLASLANLHIIIRNCSSGRLTVITSAIDLVVRVSSPNFPDDPSLEICLFPIGKSRTAIISVPFVVENSQKNLMR